MSIIDYVSDDLKATRAPSSRTVRLSLTDAGYLRRDYGQARWDDSTQRLELELYNRHNDADRAALTAWAARNAAGPQSPANWAPHPTKADTRVVYLHRIHAPAHEKIGNWLTVIVTDLQNRGRFLGLADVITPRIFLEAQMVPNGVQWWETLFHELAHIATGVTDDAETHQEIEAFAASAARALLEVQRAALKNGATKPGSWAARRFVLDAANEFEHVTP